MPTRSLVFALAVAATLTVSGQQTFMPVDDIRPGMVGIGRTVFTGTRVDEFQAHILGVIENAIAPRRTLILARLEGGPLAHYNGAVQVFAEGTGSRIVWTADFLPDEAIGTVRPMIETGMAVMKKTLDGLRERGESSGHAFRPS